MESDIIFVSFSAVSCREVKVEGILLVPGLPGPAVHHMVCPESKDPRFLDHLAPNLWSSMGARQPAQISEPGI